MAKTKQMETQAEEAATTKADIEVLRKALTEMWITCRKFGLGPDAPEGAHYRAALDALGRLAPGE